MKKILFILAAMLLSSVGLHAGNTITYYAPAQLENSYLIEGSTIFGPAITSHTFSNGKGTVTCSGEITTIGRAAFTNCYGLTQIEIPSSVTTIEEDAFYNSGLTSVEIPSSVTTIGNRAFGWCYDLTSVTVFWEDAQSIVSVDYNVFRGIAASAGPQGARLYVPTGTYNFYHQAEGWREFGRIMDPNACTITYTNPGRLFFDSYAFGHVIEDHTFSNGIGTIICDGEIKKIGEKAFYGCDNMSAINLPLSVITIEDFAFFRCASLTSFTIPSSVTTIGRSAFYECHSLKTIYCYAPNPPSLSATVFIDVPQDISVYVLDVEKYIVRWGTTLSPSCFKPITPEIDGIKYEFFVSNGYKARVIGKDGGYTGNIVIPEHIIYQGLTFTVTEIADDIFAHSGITSITLPPSITKIGMGAFENCRQLQSIILPSSLSVISNNSFQNTGLTSITIPASVERIGSWAFQECPNLKEIIIPSSSRLTSIGKQAFYNSGLTSVTIPASVNEIDTMAFQSCTQLKDLQFAERERTNPIKFGDYVFGNTALTAVDIPDWMTEIPVGLFSDNSKLETIYLPASVEKINDYSFENCPNIKYILSMSETPPALGNTNTFTKNNTTIVYVPTPEATVAYKDSKWGEYFTKIYSNITYNKTSSRTVEVVNAIPAGGKLIVPPTVFYDGSYLKVTGIADSAFYDQDSLVSISLPSSIQYIGNNAFNGCTKLKDINIEFTEDLKTIGDKAFYNTALDSIVIPEGVQSLGRAAFAFNTLHYVSLPTGLKNIPDDCFRNCYFGTEIIVPEGVETIGENSFRVPTNFEKVTLITLPSTLKEIKNYAFENRNELKEVICLAQDPPTLGETIFTNKDTAVVYVPNRDVLKIYRDSSSWKNYKFKFKDLMAEENKAYLYEVAGNNEDAKAIAQDYCDSIDNATSAQDVQQYTNIALGEIDGYTINDYKQKLAQSLIDYANGNAEAKQIAILYGQQILNAYFRQDAEQLFKEGQQKIKYIFDLIERKIDRKRDLMEHAEKDSDPDLKRVATEYGALIDRAETIEEVETLYIEGYNRITANRSIKTDWSGDKVKAKNDKLTCTTTPGYKNH